MTDTVIMEVRHYVCEALENWNRSFVEKEQKNLLPFVTLTYAQSIDGSLTAERGKPTLLSGPASLKMTHTLRTLHDGILVGRSPRPIIIDTHLRCPTTIKLFTLPTCEKPVILYGRDSQDPDILMRKQTFEMMGVSIFECQTTPGDDGRNHVDLQDALQLLADLTDSFVTFYAGVVKQHGINSIMIEGGSAILTSCLQQATTQHFIDLVVVTIVPTFIGGLRAVSSLLPSITTPSTFPRLKQPRFFVLEEDVIILGPLDH
ncbi:hypothetical protein KXD40_003078 [Peronospora effusa]|uniref:Bacterial bifunctional deaminase-reductase C-terminal domain-containing protein n=1 Tax=Peronospora effusa TaxID=542832 RepID=A0A3R7XVI5_9STRA|nr:hypothetical protein DD237_004788 [Peronospora effusa]UIZ29755.1 hypothetical protein KXD40_003078 [Peronospora effusa]